MSEKQFPASSRKLKKERERGNLGKVPENPAFISIGAIFLIIFIIKGIIPYFNRIFELYLTPSKDFHSNIMLLFQGRETCILSFQSSFNCYSSCLHFDGRASADKNVFFTLQKLTLILKN